MNRRAFLQTLAATAGALYVPTKVYSFLGSGIWTPEFSLLRVDEFGKEVGLTPEAVSGWTPANWDAFVDRFAHPGWTLRFEAGIYKLPPGVDFPPSPFVLDND